MFRFETSIGGEMILNNVRLIPELSGNISTESGAVIINDGIITDVLHDPVIRGDSDSDISNTDEEIIDCGGRTLLPGLIDMHTHITVLGRIGIDQVNSPMDLMETAALQAAKYLDHGFTTIRDCGSIHRVANHVRNMQKKGLITAPDIIACGLGLMTTEVDADDPRAQHLSLADGADALMHAARVEIANGADYVKIFASGAAANPGGIPAQAIMEREEIEAIVKAARRKDCYVAAHCHADEAVRMCAESGVYTIEHATLISDETLELICTIPGCSLIPTLAVMYLGEDPDPYWQKRLGPMFDHCTEMMAKAYRYGEKLGFGTDCAAGSIEYENGIEFRFRKENCQMADLDILIQATRNNAMIAGLDDRIGELKKGLQADMILVDGRPDEDISAMYHRPYAVWKNGVRVRG